MTSTELGRHIGVSHAAVIRWESGSAMPTPRHAKKLIQILPALSLGEIYGAAANDDHREAA